MKGKKLITFLLISVICIVTVSSAGLAAQKHFIITGGTLGGTSNLAIAALGSIAKKHCGIDSTVIESPTMGMTDVLQRKEALIATTPGDLTRKAYYGLGRWEGKAFKELRSLTDRPNGLLQFVVLADSDIYTMDDLKGKRVIVGLKGFSSEGNGKALMAALGITEENYTPIYLGFADATAAMTSGKGDVMIVAGSYPHSTLIELSESLSQGIRIIDISEEEIETIVEEAPWFAPITLDAHYKGMTDSITSVEYINVFGTTTELTEEEAYCIVKNFWEDLDFAAQTWAALGNLKIEKISSMQGLAPWHIGAYKYYQEVGLDIPENMIPPEAK